MEKPSLFDIESFKATGDISYPAILRFALIQITIAKANSNPDMYNHLIDHLETFLTPYLDEEYNNSLKAIEGIRGKERKKIDPYETREFRDLDNEAYEAKLKALIKLMERKNLLLEREMPGFEGVDMKTISRSPDSA